MPFSLQDAFRTVVARIIDRMPVDTRDWRLEDKDGVCELVIPKQSDEGFEIVVVADEHEVTVSSEYIAHDHFTSDGNHVEVSEQAMGLVCDLLTPAMRLHVIEVGGKPSRAHFEIFRAGQWHRQSTTALFSFPFFRKRAERFYINRRLPVRDEPLQA